MCFVASVLVSELWMRRGERVVEHEGERRNEADSGAACLPPFPIRNRLPPA